MSRILSNVNINKEARNGLSRRQFRRQLLQEQLSALADSVSGGGPGTPGGGDAMSSAGSVTGGGSASSVAGSSRTAGT